MKNEFSAGSKVDHPLMQNNVRREDLDLLIAYLQDDDPRLTQGQNVTEFEKEWSDWLGVKYSVYVNSGSSANLISLAVLKELYGTGDIILPPLTWVSDIAAALHNGFQPVFVDINRHTLALDPQKTLLAITDSTKAVFLTHIQGFNGLTDDLIEQLDRLNIPLIEDVCESHGATFCGQKLGTFGLMSNFSFYYAHHMTTIEGGMVCTNNQEIYELLRMYRSHGMVRETSSKQVQLKYQKSNPKLNPDFIFAVPGFNVRNTEIGALIGRSQLKRLDENNRRRSQNHQIFLDNLDSNRFRTDFLTEGSCNYAFNVILKQPDLILRENLERKMDCMNIEYRRGSSGGGNQLRQPYLQGIVGQDAWRDYPEVEHVHNYAWYIGNYPDLGKDKIVRICHLLNST